MMKILLRRSGRALLPCTGHDYDIISKIPEDIDIICEVSIKRNVRYHRLFFAVMRTVFDNIPERIAQEYHISSVDTLVDRIKIDLGEFTTEDIGGEKVLQLKSISFAKMDQSEFESFFNRAIDIISKKYLPGVTRELLLENI